MPPCRFNWGPRTRDTIKTVRQTTQAKNAEITRKIEVFHNCTREISTFRPENHKIHSSERLSWLKLATRNSNFNGLSRCFYAARLRFQEQFVHQFMAGEKLRRFSGRTSSFELARMGSRNVISSTARISTFCHHYGRTCLTHRRSARKL
jgi:hypothetical protein